MMGPVLLQVEKEEEESKRQKGVRRLLAGGRAAMFPSTSGTLKNAG